MNRPCKMTKKHIYIIETIIATLLIAVVIFTFISLVHLPKKFETSSNQVEIFPDYTNITVPLNIAPLNFEIKHKGNKHIAVFSNGNYNFKVKSKKGQISIPARKWKKLISKNNPQQYSVDIYTQTNDKTWQKYPSIQNVISADTIDSHIVFRHIDAGYILWGDMGIYQRNLENFKKTPVLLNKTTDNNCMNCHTFYKNDPSKMLIHLRGDPSGTLLFNNGEVSFINTKTDYTMSAGVYPSWHPNGNIVAFSVNLINQKFHTAGNEQINVYDRASDIITYNIDKNEVSTSPLLSTKSLENLPNWSPDGKYLYYISSDASSPQIKTENVKYSLLRIAYNETSNTWGETDTLLRASDTGKSISFPEVSPDGKKLIFCMADHGYFTIHRTSSDLYIMDLETFEYKPIDIANSEYTESYHSWSSNSKWFLFVSKRVDGLYSNVFFSHIDENGNISKPFLMPQKHSSFYQSSTLNYNRPTFIKEKVKARSYQLSQKAFNRVINTHFDEKVDIDALSGATQIKN